MRVAFLGLGRMGRELARHIQNAGHDLTVYNRTAGSAPDLVSEGATEAATPAEAVRGADAVVSVLFGPDAVRDVIVEADLAIPAGALWIDVTTVAPADTAGFDTWATSRNVRYVHSPVLGSLPPARAGALGVLLGGDPADVESATELTRLWADPTRVHRFDTPGEAAAAKLLVNLGLAVAAEALGEALRVGRSSGLSEDQIFAVLEKTPLAGIVAAKADTVRNREFEDAQFTVDALFKDAGLAMATSNGPLPALAAAADALGEQRDRGRGSWDFSVIATVD